MFASADTAVAVFAKVRNALAFSESRLQNTLAVMANSVHHAADITSRLQSERQGRSWIMRVGGGS